MTFTLSNLTPPTGDTRFTSLGGNRWLFTPNNSNQAQSFNFVTTSFAANVSVTSMEGDHYNSAGPFNLSPAFTSVTVVAQGLNFTGTNRPGNNQTVTLYTSSGQVVGTCTVSQYGNMLNRSYRNNAAITIDMSKFTTDEEVYFGYGNYYSTSSYTLTQLRNATTGNRLNINNFGTTRPW